jgi:tetratricopeptide (TPR) repeat protein
MMPLAPGVRLVIVDCHDEALQRWREAGVRAATAVHVDAHPDCEWADGDQVTIASFLSPALRDGLITTLYWIIPDAAWHDPATRAAVADYMTGVLARYPGAPVAAAPDAHELRWTVMGRAVAVRPLSALPQVDGPLLLDVDMDFCLISRLPDVEGALPPLRPWCWPEQLAAALRPCAETAAVTTISRSVDGGYVPMRWSYLADELRQRLAHPRLTEDQEAWWRQQRAARLGLDDGAIDEALERYESLLAVAPDDAAAMLGRAEALAEAGRSDEARAAYQRAVESHPRLAIVHDGVVLLWLQAGRRAETLADARRRLALDPSDAAAHYAVGRIAAADRAWPVAVRHLTAATAARPDLIDAYAALGDALDASGRAPEAIEALERALSLGLTPSATFDERFIAAGPGWGHRVTEHHAELHRRLAELYERAGRAGDAAVSRRMWQELRKGMDA